MSLKIKYEEMKIPLAGGYIAACWYGKRNERPIVAMHGWQDNAGSFALLAPLLSQYVPILAIDLPGHGKSSHFANGYIYHTLDYVGVISEIMLYFKWSKISLMGHSMSGTIIYHYTSLFPQTVDTIISIDILHTRYFTLEHQIAMLNICFEKFLINTERKVKPNIGDMEPRSYNLNELENILHQVTENSVDINKAKYILERNIKQSKTQTNKFYFSRDSSVKYLIESNTEPKLTEEMARRMRNIKWLILKAEHSYHIDENHPTTKRVLEILKENNPDLFFYIIPGVKHHCHLNNAEKVAEYIVPFILKYRSAENFKHEVTNKL